MNGAIGPWQREAKATYVYVIAGEECCKVGVSRKPRKRLSIIQVNTAKKLNLFFVLRTKSKSALEVEQAAMKLLAPWHKSGEWFGCEPAIAQAAIEAVEAGDDSNFPRFVGLATAYIAAKDTCNAMATREAYRAYAVQRELVCSEFPRLADALDPWMIF